MPYSIAGPSYPALPSLDGINKVTDAISSGEQVTFRSNAAEAAISGRQDTAIGEATVSIRNATSQISSLQKADQDLGQAGELLQQAQALAVQSENGALSSSDKDVIKNQAQGRLDEATALLEKATFNGNPQFGNGQTDTGESSQQGIDINSLQEKLESLRDSGSPLDQEALADLQNEVSSARADLGAQQNAVESQIDGFQNEVVQRSESRSAISDTDYAEQFAKLIQEEIAFEASVKVFNHRRLAEESIINLLTE
ncbi:MAG: hypothetical protein KUG79_14850 [Pseudomonadales bacterium]|nr:hypothetical protein [Pseudomonadales bacterium]